MGVDAGPPVSSLYRDRHCSAPRRAIMAHVITEACIRCKYIKAAPSDADEWAKVPDKADLLDPPGASDDA